MAVKIDRLKLKGFKSFKSVTVPIAEGYTCIVGPNGSGKSNLCDSLCFVLGTTSMKTLRADRLADLVNHFCAEAEVALELREAGDGRSVDVSRTIDKTGQSVFRVDSKRTTRFSVEELLSSFHIVPDGHNIIMQGDVARFVKMTPLQRREVIDEISGVAEYESKKAESLRELEKVQEKIKEARIVLGEREAYLQELEREKIEAEVFLKLSAEEKALRASVARRELASAEKSLGGLDAWLGANSENLQKNEEELGREQAAIKRLDEEYEKLNARIFDESSSRQSAARMQTELVQSRLSVVEEKILNTKESVEKNDAQARQALSKASETGLAISASEKEAEKLLDEEEALTAEFEARKAELEKLLSGLGFDASAFRKAEELEAQLECLKEENIALDTETKILTEKIALKKAHLDMLGIEKIKVKQKELESRIQDFQRRLEEEQKGITERVQELGALRAEEQCAAELLQKTDAELLRKQAELSGLEASVSTTKSLLGLSPAAETVVKNKELALGTVAGLCRYDAKHAAALEAAAGNKLFYVVTKSADKAVEAVKFLKKTRLGKATFIPLDKVKPPQPTAETEQALKHPQALGLAVDLVKCDDELGPAVRYVFGDTVIVATIDAAQAIGIGKVRMATLDGDLCEATGIVTGGFSKKTTISDLKQAEELRAALSRLEAQKQGAVEKVRDLRDRIMRAAEDKNKLELKIKETQVMVSEWKERLGEYLGKTTEGETLVAVILQETTSLETRLNEVLLKQPVIEKEMQRASAEKSTTCPSLPEAGEQLKAKEAEVSALREKKAELKARAKSLRGGIEKTLLPLRGQYEQEAAKLRHENKTLQDLLAGLEEQRAQLVVEAKNKEEKERESAYSLTALFKKQAELNRQRNEAYENTGKLSRFIEKLRQEASEKTVEKAKVEVRLEALRRDAEKLKDAPTIDEPMTRLRERLEEAEAQLARLGSVNLKAIDMHETLSKEVAEIRTNSQKLEEEKNSILNVITEIEDKKTRAFTDAFSALNKSFDACFKEFYPEPGSEACLKLEIPEKPLESGLLIEAKPAGKALKRIDAMSGGEKSITALAFLFAVQSYKPSPFYILDEVDAALDNENSERCAKMLKKISKELQLIIITHNPHVIKNADQVIGVHMAKDGSSLIEVDLKKYGAQQITAKA